MPDEIPPFQECPECKQKSLRWRQSYRLYECTNDECKTVFSEKDLAKRIDIQKASDSDDASDAVQKKVDIEYSYPKMEIIEKPKTRFLGIHTNIFLFSALITGIFAIVAYFVIYNIFPLGPLVSPSNFSVSEGNTQNVLSWTNSENSDRVMIRYKVTGMPTSTNDGTQLYLGTGTSYTHRGLANGTTYYYVIWSGRTIGGQTTWSDTNKFASGTPYWIGASGERTREYVEMEGARIVGADGDYIVDRQR